MPDYRRSLSKGGTFFFTVVTYRRHPVFKAEVNVELLRQSFKKTIAAHPFAIDAIVILPDHLHTLWTLPDHDSDYSTRWRLIKSAFSRHYTGSAAGGVSESMLGKSEKGIWQRRFWEHLIWDDTDFGRHCDYIHYNPVKHGIVASPIEWKYSSFRSFVERGFYATNWGDGGVELEGMDFE
ncbi:MAG: transposase [Chloroflexi bacterium]|nr:transposase [Chloroflexota bacterium]